LISKELRNHSKEHTDLIKSLQAEERLK